MKVSPARAAAFDALFRIETETAFSSVVLPIVEAKLPSNDRSLCHEIVLGVLRRKIYLDRFIDQLSAGRKLDPEVRIALQIGLFQMIFLDRVPAHSAINESVELVASARKRSAVGFVNALLRSFQRDPIEPTFADEIEELSVTTSHPRWLAERWISQFGPEEARNLCEANNRTPGLAFRLVNRDLEQRETLETINALDGVRRSDLVDGCFVAPRMNETLARLSESNRIYFQDEGAQLMGNAVNEEGGSRILDLCAAPGGKTTMIARNAAMIVAGDVISSRANRLRETCAAHGVWSVSILQYDAEIVLPFDPGIFDTVFVDAPCSGTGTIRHNPEIRFTIDGEDIAQLSKKQLRILENASELVKQGGTLVYSTCSLEPEENEVVCERFIQEYSGFELGIPKIQARFLDSNGFGRTFPHRDDMDGFFIAVFRRR